MEIELSAFPSLIQLETTTICPSDCVMCPHRNVTRKKFMDSGLIEKVLSECRGRQVTIMPHQMGDPFADERMLGILKRCKEFGLGTALSTTAFLLTEEKIKDLMAIGIDQLNISIDSVDKDTYEKIRRNLKFDRVMENIDKIFKLRNRATRILVSAVNLGMTDSEKKGFESFWKGKADVVQVESFVRYPDIDSPMLPRTKVNKLKGCYRVESQMVIMTTGEVAKCCIDYNGIDILGDVNNETVEEAWNGERRKAILTGLKEKGRAALKPCATCNL